MSSDAKIAANRANAKKSTGPRTAAGKAASSRNNTRHGLTANKLLLDTEDPAQYEALRSDLIGSYRPANAAELMLVEEIAQNFWRLQRARNIETENMNMCAAGADPIIKFGCAQVHFDNIRRYMTGIERAWHRAMQQLESMQKIRARQISEEAENEAEPEEDQPTASIEPRHPQLYDTQRPFVVPAERSESKRVDPAQPPGH
jgi:hypothetical protein